MDPFEEHGPFKSQMQSNDLDGAHTTMASGPFGMGQRSVLAAQTSSLLTNYGARGRHSLGPKPVGSTQTLQPEFSIKKHNMAVEPTGKVSPLGTVKDHVLLAPVPQISGRGKAVSPPTDRQVVINNVIKPFEGKSEEDRRRATQILDFIIGKRKAINKLKEDWSEARKNEEQRALLAQLEEEQNEKEAARRMAYSGSVSDGQSSDEQLGLEQGDKFGGVR